MSQLMSTNATPREVFEQLINGVAQKRWTELPNLYAEDAVVEHPFAIPAPTRLEGQEAIRRHFARAVDLPLEMTARNVVVHETTDPEVIVAEFETKARMTTTDHTFTFGQIYVLRVRDGKIVASHDYANHYALDVALGWIPKGAAAVSDQ